MSARVFGFTLFYRPISPELVGYEPDVRPVAQLPSCGYPTKASEAERDRALLEEAQKLEALGYRVERVVRESFCAGCEGVGTKAVRPKGWRKKTPPPWYAMRRQVCQDCGGGGAEHVVESVQTLVSAPAAAEAS